MNKKLLVLGGSINVLFTIFHIWLVWQLSQLTGLSPEIKSLLLMLALGGVLIIGYAAYVSLFCIKDMLTTKLGNTAMILVIVIYTSRAAEEIVLAPKFSPLIFCTCLVTAIIYVLTMVYNRKTGVTCK
jgi:hypothetical protein